MDMERPFRIREGAPDVIEESQATCRIDDFRPGDRFAHVVEDSAADLRPLDQDLPVGLIAEGRDFGDRPRAPVV